jgi:hypothetical protein
VVLNTNTVSSSENISYHSSQGLQNSTDMEIFWKTSACMIIDLCDIQPHVLLERWIFRKWDVGVWTGSSWLRIGTGGGHL